MYFPDNEGQSEKMKYAALLKFKKKKKEKENKKFH